MRKLVVFLAIVAVMIVGCGEVEEVKPETKPEPTVEKKAEEPKAEEKKEEPKVEQPKVEKKAEEPKAEPKAEK